MKSYIMELIKTLIIYSLAVLAIIFLYYVYQTKEINDKINKPIVYDFKDFDVICPDDYYYVGTVEGKDKCQNYLDNSTTLEFPTLLEDGRLELPELNDNTIKSDAIDSRCNNKNNVTFSALKPFCDN